ncbi:MAG: purine-nucleoside phosphorylase [Oscillospiraceae bacterium]
MATPHNSANVGDIAKTVLMPGDPLRAKYIAETYLKNAICFNLVRNMLGYTGDYEGKRISVMGSGMGIPSMGIYSHELYNVYGVDNIIRIGTAGAVSDKVSLLDIVIAQGSCTNSNFASQYGLSGDFAPLGSYSLIEKAVSSAKNHHVIYHVGNVFSSDIFYDGNEQVLQNWAKMGVLAVEMESAGLYITAAAAQKKALCIATISDCPLKGLSTSSSERQSSFTKMMEIALDVATQI